MKSELGKELELSTVIKGKKTYPSWTTGTKYYLESKKVDNDKIEIFYQMTSSPTS